jgi:hypothetical protein
MVARADPRSPDKLRIAQAFLPRPGCSRSTGTWTATGYVIQAYSLAGRREEAGQWQAIMENIAATEALFSTDMLPILTIGGIAAAGAKHWATAEDHHQAAIQRMDAMGCRGSLAVAHYWYADMLLERSQPGDLKHAQLLLEKSIASSEELDLFLYARLARERLSSLA